MFIRCSNAILLVHIGTNNTDKEGTTIVRKTDTILSKGHCIFFIGSKNRACDVESRADHGMRKWRDHTSTRRDEQRRQRRNNIDSGEVQEPT